MWPFTRRSSGQRSSEAEIPRQRESERALDAAKQSLEETLRERKEVYEVSGVVRYHLERNHISERVGLLLRSLK